MNRHAILISRRSPIFKTCATHFNIFKWWTIECGGERGGHKMGPKNRASIVLSCLLFLRFSFKFSLHIESFRANNFATAPKYYILWNALIRLCTPLSLVLFSLWFLVFGLCDVCLPPFAIKISCLRVASHRHIVLVHTSYGRMEKYLFTKSYLGQLKITNEKETKIVFLHFKFQWCQCIYTHTVQLCTHSQLTRTIDRISHISHESTKIEWNQAGTATTATTHTTHNCSFVQAIFVDEHCWPLRICVFTKNIYRSLGMWPSIERNNMGNTDYDVSVSVSVSVVCVHKNWLE